MEKRVLFLGEFIFWWCVHPVYRIGSIMPIELMSSDQLVDVDIFIHIGLPKTGTSALQKYLYDNSSLLLSKGVFYDLNVNSADDPKHQWLISILRQAATLQKECNLSRFCKHDRVILTTESITNEFPLFGRDSIKYFGDLIKKYGKVGFLLVLREPSVWAKSYYKQSIMNAKSTRMPFYGTSLCFEEYIRLPYIRKLMDQEWLADSIEKAFSVPVFILRYEQSTIEEIAQVMVGGDLLREKQKIKTMELNSSVSDVSAEIMRQINGLVDCIDEKQAWSYILGKTTQSGSVTLKTLGRRASRESIYALNMSKLDCLHFDSSSSLGLNQEDFNNLVEQVRRELKSFKNTFN